MILLQALACAVSFLTRIPTPGREALPPRTAGLSILFFPFVGLILGLAAAGTAWLVLDHVPLPPHLIWSLALITLHALLTGALHLDGLSDVVDGLGGGRGDRERTLEIMKDTHIGAFGVVSLVLLLGAKILLMGELLTLPQRLPLLAAFPVAARLGAALLIVAFPCARATGLARTFHEGSRWTALLVAAGSAGGILWFLGPATWIPSAWALGTAFAIGAALSVRLRGLTGDVYGAAVELSETAFLAAAVWSRLKGA